jgi:hypothetical protein
MSLMHLLAMGRSLIGGGARPGRYRTSTVGMLPKFPAAGQFAKISAAEPAAPPCSGSASAVTPSLFSEPGEGAKSVAAAPLTATVSSQETVAMRPGRLARNASIEAARSENAEAAPSPDRKNPFGGGRGRSRKIVQAELSLDSVTVVRNDLRDADLEVVTLPRRKRDSNVFAEASNSEGGEKGEGRSVWQRIRMALF